jgi:hypothetical protein
MRVLMNFLISGMDGLMLKLYHGYRRSMNIRQIRAVTEKVGQLNDPAPGESGRYDRIILCKAVEERICRKIDLASRTDLTLSQAADAVRLLLKIISQNNLSIEISPGGHQDCLRAVICRKLCWCPIFQKRSRVVQSVHVPGEIFHLFDERQIEPIPE